jgi:hypothetical protein
VTPAITSPGDPTRSKASPELRALARLLLETRDPEDALVFAHACEAESVNGFKLLSEEQSARAGEGN